jgi:chemotaxis signal transduction protein
MRLTQPALVLPSQALNVTVDLPDPVDIDRDSGLSQSIPNQEALYGLPISNYGLLISTDSNSQVLGRCDICQLPHTHTWFLGMANLNGVIAPVFDLLAMLNIPNHVDTKERRYMVLGRGEDAVGFQIDGSPRLVRIEDMEINQSPSVPQQLQNYVGTCFQGEINWFVWDYKQFFSNKLGSH